jgi:dTDP-4-amino-4,6-dideoxygalactose transaminase
MWKVPLFDTAFDEKEVEAAQQVIRSGWLTMGDITAKFEKLYAEFLGVKHAIAVSSGTAALHLANLSLGITNGDEVICPALTFVACANSIICAGGTPVFADITSHDDFNISPDDIEKKITERTKAIEVVHYAGFPCNMDRVRKIADKYKLSIIEDCAHAHGAEYSGRKCGTLGQVGCFSFFPNKNMTTAEGGMMTTNDDELANKIRLMRSHGMTSVTMDRHRGHAFSYDVVEQGFNYRMDEIRSSIGIVQLKKLQECNRKRGRLTQIYSERLSDIQGVSIPFRNHVGISSHHIYPVLLGSNINREKFMGYLKEKGIQTSIHYPPIHKFAYYRQRLNYADICLNITEDVAGREVTLPLYPSMNDETIQYVCDMITEYFRKGVKKQ